MRKIKLTFSIFLAVVAFSRRNLNAMELQTSFLPSYLYRADGVGVLRADTTLLFGGDYFLFGPFALYESVSPQATDTSVGAALRIGRDQYFEVDAGYFQRSFTQAGSAALSGNGFSASLIWGVHLSPHLGASVVVTGKRISSGSLEQRTIVDLLPLFTMRTEF